jgi:hypothetical protein
MIMVSLTYYGPAKDAERIYASTHPDKFAGKAMCTTAMLDWEKMNHGFEALNRHGGFKDYASAFVYGLDVESVSSLDFHGMLSGSALLTFLL